jgi:hypothetical protein
MRLLSCFEGIASSVLCLWAQMLQEALSVVGALSPSALMIWIDVEVVEVEEEEVAALHQLVSKFRPLAEMRVEVEAEAEAEAVMHHPLWQPLSAKIVVGFRDSLSTAS